MQTSFLARAPTAMIDRGSLTAVRARLPRAAGPERRPASDEPLFELAARAGYRIERSSRPGLWLLIDADGELVRTPSGERAWPAAAARQRLETVASLGRFHPAPTEL